MTGESTSGGSGEGVVSDGAGSEPASLSGVPEGVVEGQQEAGEGGGETSAKKAKEVKEAVKEEIRKYKLKVNGKEREYDENMIKVLAQKGLAADEKFQLSAAERKKSERLAQLAKNDPDQFIREARGQEPIEYYKEKIAEEIKRLSMDPKDLELADMKKKLESFEKKAAEESKKAQEAKMKEASDRMLAHYESELTQGIKASGLPATEQTIAYAAEIMLNGLEMGQEIPMDVVTQMVRERYVNEYQGLIGKLDGEDLINLLGESTVKKLLMANGKKATSALSGGVHKESQAAAEPDKRQPKKWKTKEEFDKYIEEWSKTP